jgi:hypothetical protein
MIIENIDDDPGILMIFGSNALLVSTGDGMPVCEGIDIPVDQDPLFDLFGKLQVAPSLHIIPHKISHNDLFIATGQVGMCEKVQILSFWNFDQNIRKIL